MNRTLDIHFHIYRSNPVIYRSAAVPGTFPVNELPELCCLLLGIDSASYWYENCIDPETTDRAPSIPKTGDEDQPQCPEMQAEPGGEGFLHSGMTGRIRLSKDSQTARFFFLEIFWRVFEGTEESVDFPVLKGWSGFQLPSGNFSISAINEMQSVLLKEKMWTNASGDVLYRDDYLLNLKKAGNSLCRRYAPEQARDEIRMEYGIPGIDLLGNVTLQEIKQKLDHIHCYGYATAKKAECIQKLSEMLKEVSCNDIFGAMEMKEYQNFRQLVLKGITDCQNNDDLMREFPVLWSELRIRFIKKQGIRLSREILEAYEKWFDSPEELSFRANKRIRQAMRWCCFYYGIFSLEHCYQVLQAVYPDEVKKEDLLAYWKYTPDFAAAEHVSFTGSMYRQHSPEEYAYDPRVIKSDQISRYLTALQEDSSQRKLPPDPETFETMAVKSICYTRGDGKIQNLEEKFSYSTYYSSDLSSELEDGIHLMRCGMSWETAAKQFIETKYWYSQKQQRDHVITEYLKIEAENIPLLFYYGFTRPEIKEMHLHSQLKENYQKLLQEEEEKKQQAKRLAQESRLQNSASRRGTSVRGRKPK